MVHGVGKREKRDRQPDRIDREQDDIRLFENREGFDCFLTVEVPLSGDLHSVIPVAGALKQDKEQQRARNNQIQIRVVLIQIQDLVNQEAHDEGRHELAYHCLFKSSIVVVLFHNYLPFILT